MIFFITAYYDADKDMTGGRNCTDADIGRDDNDVCSIDMTALTKECNEANSFGYDEGKPCVLLRLNKVSESVF